MELYAAGLNAWNQLRFGCDEADAEPDDLHTFTCVLADDDIRDVRRYLSWTTGQSYCQWAVQPSPTNPQTVHTKTHGHLLAGHPPSPSDLPATLLPLLLNPPPTLLFAQTSTGAIAYTRTPPPTPPPLIPQPNPSPSLPLPPHNPPRHPPLPRNPLAYPHPNHTTNLPRHGAPPPPPPLHRPLHLRPALLVLPRPAPVPLAQHPPPHPGPPRPPHRPSRKNCLLGQRLRPRGLDSRRRPLRVGPLRAGRGGGARGAGRDGGGDARGGGGV